MTFKSTSGSSFTSRRLILNSASRPSPGTNLCLSLAAIYPCARWLTNFSPYSLFGRGIYIRFSSLLRNASSMSQGKFVAAKTITILPWSSLKHQNQIFLILHSQNKIMLNAQRTYHYFIKSMDKQLLTFWRTVVPSRMDCLGTENEGTTILWNNDYYSLDTASYQKTWIFKTTCKF